MSGDAPELWNFDEPEKIQALHRGFVEAGADILLTNSFGGTRYRLKLHKAEGRVAELNRRAAELARGRRRGRTVAVAGSMGPTGEILEPLGPLTIADATLAFAEQARALAEGGVDVLWIETMSSADEVRGGGGGRPRPACHRLHAELRHQRPHHDGPVPNDFRGAGRTLEAAPGGLRQQLRQWARPSGGPHPQPGQAAGPVTWCWWPGQLRHPAVRERPSSMTARRELMAVYARLARDAGAHHRRCCGTSPKHLRCHARRAGGAMSRSPPAAVACRWTR